jgi:hypothetical protein
MIFSRDNPKLVEHMPALNCQYKLFTLKFKCYEYYEKSLNDSGNAGPGFFCIR